MSQQVPDADTWFVSYKTYAWLTEERVQRLERVYGVEVKCDSWIPMDERRAYLTKDKEWVGVVEFE